MPRLSVYERKTLAPERALQRLADAFDNQWTVSVHWSAGNYCANRDARTPHDINESPNAEVLITKPNGTDLKSVSKYGLLKWP